MSFEIWTEKYRPKKIDDIINQEEIKKALKKFVEHKNMPHLLLVGPPGTGKTTSALALAHELYGDAWRENFLELNASVSKNTPILVRVNGQTRRTTFGELDTIYFSDKNNVLSYGDGEYVRTEGLEVLTVDRNYKVTWAKVKYLIRHKARKILRIKLEGGGTLELTGNHSVMVLDENEKLATKHAKDLNVGDYLLVLNNESYLEEYSRLVSGNTLLLQKFEEATGDLGHIKIKGIEVVDYDDYVYDISVPGNEMFFAGEIPILLHNSDERGIEVIRHKVKEFARAKPIGDVPFKIVFLDEADALTRDAQQALRRIMEKYSATTRFILSCNYFSKIIEPIQSRVTVFKFKPLEKEAFKQIVDRIVKGEGLILEDEQKVVDALYDVAEGDLRKAINILQAAAMIDKLITVDRIYEIASVAKPKEIDEILDLALTGQFSRAREKLIDIMLKYGMSGEDVVKAIQKRVWGLPLSDKYKLLILDKIGEIEFRIVEGADDMVQLDALLAWLGLLKGNK